MYDTIWPRQAHTGGEVEPQVGVEPTTARIPSECYFHLSFRGMYVEPKTGLEPATSWIRIRCSSA